MEYLYFKKCFSLYTARRFQKSESGAGILFMKIHVRIVHLVTNAHKLCYKAALGLSVNLSKTVTSETFWSICMQNAFSPSSARRFQEIEGGAGICS